jgi:hypothetical protein
MRQAVFDFRTDGPPLQTCQLCSKRFRDWKVADAVWQRIRAEFQSFVLCQNCLAQQLGQAGINPHEVKISYAPWYRRQILWALENRAVPDLAHIQFVWGRIVPETMWCQVLREIPGERYRVRVQKTSCIDERLRKGKVLTATWDGQEVHHITGRPIFRPLDPLVR